MILLQSLDECRHVGAHSKERWKDTVILGVMVMVKDYRVEVPVLTNDWLERRGFQLRCGPPGASNIKEVLMELLQVLMECLDNLATTT